MCNLTCVALMLGLATPEPAQSKDHLAGLRKKLASPFSSDVTAGANGLAKMGADALPAVPDLAAALKKAKFDSERAALASALQKVVGDARATVPGLRAELRKARGQRKAAIEKRLSEIRSATTDAVNALADALANRAKFKDERIAIARALGSFGPDAKPAVKALAAALKTGFSENQIAAAQALGQIGPAAKDAIPALTDASKTGFLDVRKAAEAALAKIKK